MTTARIESIFVGRPQSFDSEGVLKPWTSAIYKRRTTEPVRVCLTNIDGDQQADLVHHGGPDKAVLAYPVSHYEYWQTRYPDSKLQAGSFGENLSVTGLDESQCCIGDIFQVADCVLQISQPRQPCWKLSRRWNLSDLATEVQKTRRTGWYLRVLQEGQIAQGAEFVLLERPYPSLKVNWANEVMFAKPRNQENDRTLASCPLLSESWRQNLSSRSIDSNDGSEQPRLNGG
jgi:MOSC domain-containing protein YiiM